MVAATIIFGGSFDPIHLGHLHIAEEVRVTLQYDRVLFLPNSLNPLKQASHASPIDRLEMVKLAIASNPHFGVSDIEMEQPGFTVDSVRRLRENAVIGKDVVLLVGDDIVTEIHKWKDIEILEEMIHIVVVSRLLKPVRGSMEYLDAFCLPISSTEIRNRLRMHQPFQYLLPEAVFSYIQKKGLYKE